MERRRKRERDGGEEREGRRGRDREGGEEREREGRRGREIEHNSSTNNWVVTPNECLCIPLIF